jgi:hypothetical protein
MPIIQVGNIGANYQPDGDTVRQGADGSGEATLTYKVSAVGFTLANIPAPLSVHPVYSQLRLYEASVAREAGSWMTVTATYRGVLLANPSIYMQEQFTISTTEAPVETHPFFSLPRAAPRVTSVELSQIRKALESNIEYNVNNYPAVTAFGIVLWQKLRRGIESYLRIGGVYRQTYIQSDIPQNYSGMGRIAAVAGAPATPAGTNFLWTAFNWRKQGGVVTVEKEYTLSGLEGWEPELYDSTYLAAFGL